MTSPHPNKGQFSDQVLSGPTPAVTATIRLSYRTAFDSRLLARTAALWRLSPRETQVLVLTLKGLSMPRIAEALGVALGTAKLHREHVRRKMGVSSVEQLVVKWFLSCGLLLRDVDRELIETSEKPDEMAWKACGEWGGSEDPREREE